MKNRLQRFLLWGLKKTGWEPSVPELEKLIVERVITIHRDFSGNAHQRRIMRRASQQAYGK